MAQLLKGKPVAEAILNNAAERAQALRSKGISPTLAILRVGERADDISYENNAVKKCIAAGVSVKRTVLPSDVAPKIFFETLEFLNTDPSVHGILMFRPLPKHLDEEAARRILCPEKDVDGCTDISLAGVFAGTQRGFAPCTAEAVMQMLAFYDIDPAGKHAVILGRSTTVGRPVSMLLMHKNATVTICHSKTKPLEKYAREAAILICAIGKPEYVNASFLSQGQTVIDVGINWNEKKQKLCGDVLFEEAEPVVCALTPVPAGVGAVTSALLVKHTVEAAEKQLHAD